LLQQAAPRSSQNGKRKCSEVSSSSPQQNTAGESGKSYLKRGYRHLPEGTKFRVRNSENKLREYPDVHEALPEHEKKTLPSVDEDENLGKRLYKVCLEYGAVPGQEYGTATDTVVSHQADIEAPDDDDDDDDDRINTYVFSQLAISDQKLPFGHRAPLSPPARLPPPGYRAFQQICAR
jgi:hypothetical protein